MSQLRKGHLASTDDMLQFRAIVHRHQIICHRNHGEQENEKKCQSYEGAPVVLRVALSDGSRPSEDQSDRDRQPQKIEE
jgi:hypothetical protein